MFHKQFWPCRSYSCSFFNIERLFLWPRAVNGIQILLRHSFDLCLCLFMPHKILFVSPSFPRHNEFSILLRKVTISVALPHKQNKILSQHSFVLVYARKKFYLCHFHSIVLDVLLKISNLLEKSFKTFCGRSSHSH